MPTHNEPEASELILYIDNTPIPYRHRAACDMNMARKIKRGVCDRALAPKLYRYVADDAARAYRKEYHMTGGFDPATRQVVADRLAARFFASVDAGLWGDLPEDVARLLAPKEAAAMAGWNAGGEG